MNGPRKRRIIVCQTVMLCFQEEVPAAEPLYILKGLLGSFILPSAREQAMDAAG